MACKTLLSLCGKKGRMARYVKLWMPYSSVSGVCSPVRASCSHPSCFSASAMEKRPVPRTAFKGTLQNSDSTTRADGFICDIKVFTWILSCFDIKSHLFNTITLANSTWSQRRWEMVLWSSGSACQLRVRRDSKLSISRINLDPSTTVTRVSICATSPSRSPVESSKVNVSATGIGSEIPDDSINK